MSKIKITFLLIAFFIALGIFGFGKFVENHTWKSLQSGEYTLDCDFSKVRNIMVRADALEAVVAQEHGVILKKEWKSLIVSGERPLRFGLDFDGQFDFSVSKKDSEIGQIVLRFSQTIHITRNKIESITQLIEPVGYIKDICTKMEMKPQNEKTHVNNSSFIEYERKVPKYMIESIQKKLDESNKRSLINNERAITDLIKRYIDKNIILPFMKDKQ
jgi:hypothetical protein